MHQTHDTKLGKVIGSEDKVELRALVSTVRNLGNTWTDRNPLSEWGIEKAHPFLVRCTPKVAIKTLENTTPLAKIENMLPMCRHIKVRFQQSNHKMLQDTCYTDTKFALVKSFEGYNSASLFWMKARIPEGI